VRLARWLWVLGLALPLHGQQVLFTVDVADAVRDSLARAWNDTDPRQYERGYCVTYLFGMDIQRQPHYDITGFVAPDTLGPATPMSVWFRCPKGSLRLHVHTPTTCDQSRDSVYLGTCRLGGPLAYVCAPSLGDLISLTQSGKRLELLQCDRHAIIVFVPLRGPLVRPDSAAGTD
jgi:hypothetical protein